MPHKPNACRRHRIRKMKFKVTNWAEYEAGLRRRGSLTLWITPEALSGWAAPRRKTRGGQPLYSDLAPRQPGMKLVPSIRWRARHGGCRCDVRLAKIARFHEVNSYFFAAGCLIRIRRCPPWDCSISNAFVLRTRSLSLRNP